MNRPTPWLPISFVALTVLVFAGFFGWRYYQSTQEPAVAEAAAPADSALQAPAEAPSPAPSTGDAPAGIEHPVEEMAVETESEPVVLPGLDESDDHVSRRLSGLIGQQNVLTFLQLDGFVRRVVATVDNLPRQQAPSAVWPVNPSPQRFMTLKEEGGGAETIHPDNSQRYVPLVRMVESVDTAKAVAVYRSLYPLFQQAYEELGFPGRYFNDRVVQVLDHLIATPVQSGPLAVTLVEVKGEVPSTRPWTRYEFADPALESLSAGRKMLLRTGPDNHRRLQARLVDLRQRIARQ